MQNISGQLTLFKGKTLNDHTLSPLEVLAKILVLLAKDKVWKDRKVVLLAKPYGSLLKPDQTFLSGKMLKEYSPQMMAQTFGQLSKPLPTLGVIDLNGNCLIRHGFYPKIESGFTLSELLEKEVDEKYFLSEKMVECLSKETTGGMEVQTARTINARCYKMGRDDNYLQVADYRKDEGLRVRKDGNTPTLQARAREDIYGQPVIIKPILSPDRVNMRQNGRRIKENGDDAFTLTAMDRHGIMIDNVYKSKGQAGKIHDINGISPTISGQRVNSQGFLNTPRIRRLTEIECEKLQGFSKNWTKYGEKGNKISSSQRYKCLGNAVSIPVVKAVGESILKSIKEKDNEST